MLAKITFMLRVKLVILYEFVFSSIDDIHGVHVVAISSALGLIFFSSYLLRLLIFIRNPNNHK